MSDSLPRRVLRAVAAPVERFLAIEAASGIVLLLAAMAALALANSPLGAMYEAFWSFSVGPSAFARDLRWWVNDGLMSLFFFVVGLEIRRELHQGELSEPKRAALPVVAAVGGMIAPALIYLAFNAGHAAVNGWGVPMATDIAFAVGVFALLGRRVAPALRILLLALAVIDDLGAIVVIALFYAGGVHPTIVGVIAGLLVPVRARAPELPSLNERFQSALHGAVAYGIMPLFAFGNAGVALGAASFDADGARVFAGIFFGLLVGKPVGIFLACRAAVAGGIATAPRGVTWTAVGVVGVVAGIGFTMALFVAQLAFPAGPLLETAKLAILCASTAAGAAGLLAGRWVLAAAANAAKTEEEAEQSAEV